jgi:hypothetical protein
MNEQSRSHQRTSSSIPNGNGNGSFTNNPASPTSTTNTSSDRSLTSLIKELANDVTAVFTKEVALAKSEVSHSVHEAKTGAVSMLTGGSVLYAGVLFLLLAAVLGLSKVVELWLAALIVGGVVTLIGLIMVQSGKKKLEPSALTPRHTMNSLHKDREAVKGAVR